MRPSLQTAPADRSSAAATSSGRILRYLWASPVTALGLLACLLTRATGGALRLLQGTLEIHGGFARWFLRRIFRAQAMTLGHVILGVSPIALAICRAHERAHVRQCERWGIFFLPAYVLASLWAVLRGGHYYWDNAFEIGAERAAAVGSHVASQIL